VDLFLVILKALGTSFGITAIFLIFFLVGMLFWVRAAVRDKTYCFFLSVSRQLRGKLLKPKQNTILVGSGEDAPKYLTHPSKQFWSYWPPGFPRFIQEPVPTLFFVEGNVEPLDPYDRKSLISPESLRKISDEAMLKQTWKDVRETLGIKSGLWGSSTLMLVLLIVAILVAGVAAFLSFSSMDQLNTILEMLGG